MSDLNKPGTLKDLLAGGHVSLGAVRNIAKTIFDGKTSAAFDGVEGYVLTSCSFDDLPDHVQGFITKAILAFTVENLFDAAAELDEPDEDDELDVAVTLEEAITED